MHRAVLLYLAVLVGCASGPPDQYHRGTFVRPPPAQHRPGVGLHIPGQPVRKPDVQPQPRPKRYLPPEPDGRQGIWATSASDAPHPNDDGKPAPLVLEVRLPYEDLQYEPKDREHVRECAKKGDAALRATLTPDQIKDLTKAERECLAMAMYALCGKYWWDPHRTIMDETLSRDERSVLNQLARMADQRFRNACHTTPTNLTDRVNRAFANAAGKWHEMSQ